MRLTRRSAITQTGLAFAAASLACRESVSPVRDRPTCRPSHLVDLTHTLSPAFPFIPVQNKTFPFRMSPIATVKADGVYAQRWELTEHVGTHLDAPCHFIEGGLAVDQLPVNSLFVPLAVVSIANRATTDPDAALEVDDLVAWERVNGRLPDAAAVFVHTAWDMRVSDAPTFVNMDTNGMMHFPGFAEAAAEFLITQRRIAGIGIDTLSIDPGRDTAYPVHKRLFAAGKWAVECLANLAQVPAVGATVFVGPVKVQWASGAPARVVAFW
jgi:kynurenine formamidase